MNIKTITTRVSAILLTALLFQSCQKEEEIIFESIKNEFLTTVQLRLISGTDTVVGTWKDLTPEDATPPDTSQAFLNLKTNKVYEGEAILLDETQSPAFNVSEKIKERANIHLFGYLPDANLAASSTYEITDFDTNTPALPLGLKFRVTVGANPTNGRLNVILKHQPNLKNGTLTPGSSDVDVKFNVSITN